MTVIAAAPTLQGCGEVCMRNEEPICYILANDAE